MLNSLIIIIYVIPKKNKNIIFLGINIIECINIKRANFLFNISLYRFLVE
jgi:hypothetical protein